MSILKNLLEVRLRNKMAEEFNLRKKMDWLLKALISEEKEESLSIEYILRRSEVEFAAFIKRNIGCGEQDVEKLEHEAIDEIWLSCGDFADGLNESSGKVYCERCKKLKASLNGSSGK